MRTSRPVSSATSRMAVSSIVSPRSRRALGQGPGVAVALASTTADDEMGTSALVTNDDAAGRRGGGVPQACHGAVAARGRRPGPERSDRAHCIWTSGRGRPPRIVGVPDAGHASRHGAGPAGSTGRRCNSVARGPGRGEGRQRAETEASLARATGRADESGRRPSRVLGGDAVSHGRQWYRVRVALQAPRRAPRPCASAVSGASAPRARARSISRRAAATYSVQDAGGMRPERGEVGGQRPDVTAGHRAGQRRAGSRALARCPACPR